MSKNKNTRFSDWQIMSLEILLIVLVALAFLWPTRNYKFTQFDDQYLITKNEKFLSRPDVWTYAFTTDVFPENPLNNIYYRPMLGISYAMDYRMDGLNPQVYHTSNLIWHVLAGLVLYGILLFFGVGGGWRLMWTCLFLLHPLVMPTIGLIPGRNDLLLSVFAGLSSLFFFYAIRKQSYILLALQLLMFACALFTKESAIVLPILWISWWIWVEKKSWKEKPLIISSIGWILWIGVFLFARSKALANAPESIWDAFQQGIKGLPSLSVYLTKVIFPIDLNPLAVWWGGLSGITIAGLAVFGILIYLNRKSKSALWAMSWFILLLIPAILFPNPNLKYNFIYEHRAHTALMGMVIFFALTRIPALQKIASIEKYKFLLLLPVLIIFYSLSKRYLPAFSDRLPFWEYTVSKDNKVFTSVYNLGGMYGTNRIWNKAIEQFQRCIELEPKREEGYLQLAVCYYQTHQDREAEQTLKQLTEALPQEPKAWYYLGEYYAKLGMKEDAIRAVNQCLAIQPQFTAGIDLLQKLQPQPANNASSQSGGEDPFKGF